MVEEVIIREANCVRPDNEKPAIRLDTEITVRLNGFSDLSFKEAAMVKAILEVSTLLVSNKKKNNLPFKESASAATLSMLDQIGGEMNATKETQDKLDLSAWYGNKSFVPMASGPVSVQVALTHAISLDVSSSFVNEPLGRNLVMITIRHSNSHMNVIQVDNLSIHLVQSELLSGDALMPSTYPHSAIDMSHLVQWSLLSESPTSPCLPITVRPYESHALILTLDASDDTCARMFRSPVYVHSTLAVDSMTNVREARNFLTKSHVEWKSSRRPCFETCDAFCVSLRIVPMHNKIENGLDCIRPDDAKCPPLKVGETFGVQLDVTNLWSIDRNVRVHVLDNQNCSGRSDSIVNATTTVHANGNQFSIFPNPCSTTKCCVLNPSRIDRCTKSKHLLPLDSLDPATAIPSFPLRREQAATILFRFVPTRSGPLKIPSFRLLDIDFERQYDCLHTLVAFVSES
jgi:hypothetical protein